MWKIESERADLFDVNMLITMEVKTSAKFTKKQIEDAFYKTIDSYEILNTKVFIDDNGDAFYKENKENNNKLFFTSSTLKEIISEQEKNRFLIENGEFLKLFVSIENNSFIFILHHLGGDGKSLLYFIESFLKSINNEKLEFNKIRLLNKDTLPKIKLPFLIRLFVNHYNRKWQKEKRAFTFSDMHKSFNNYWKSNKTIVEIDEVNDLDNILMECKNNKIGYTSYDIACRIKDIGRLLDIGLAVDGRTDKNRTMSNQATGISIKYKYNKNKSLIDNAKKINSLIRNKLEKNEYKYFVLYFMSLLDPTLVDAINLEHSGYFHSKTSSKLAKILGYKDKTKDLSITNLTKADIKLEYENFKIDKITFIPPVVSYGKNIIGMITTNGILVSTRHYYG